MTEFIILKILGIEEFNARYVSRIVIWIHVQNAKKLGTACVEELKVQWSSS